MNRMMLAAVAALFLCAGQAGALSAQPAPTSRIAPAPQKVHGIVAAVTDNSVTLTQNDGTSATVDFLANQTIMLVAPATLDQIQPGGHVTALGKTQADGTVIAREFSLFPSDAPHHGAERAIGNSGAVLTSGTVTTVVKIDAGRLVTVDYGSGTRQITVLGGIRITRNTPVARDQVRPGAKVYVTTLPPGETFRGQQTIVIFAGGL